MDGEGLPLEHRVIMVNERYLCGELVTPDPVQTPFNLESFSRIPIAIPVHPQRMLREALPHPSRKDGEGLVFPLRVNWDCNWNVGEKVFVRDQVCLLSCIHSNLLYNHSLLCTLYYNALPLPGTGRGRASPSISK